MSQGHFLPSLLSPFLVVPDDYSGTEKEIKEFPQPPREIDFFKKGFAWIRPKIDELLAAGWSKPELFRRGKFKHPIGNWGIAWL